MLGLGLSIPEIAARGGGADPLAPAAPLAPDLQAASDTGASNTDNITSDTTPTFDTTLGEAAAENDVVSLVEGATTLASHTVTLGEAGGTAFTLTASALALGGHLIRVKHDRGGHASQSPGLTVTIESSGTVGEMFGFPFPITKAA